MDVNTKDTRPRSNVVAMVALRRTEVPRYPAKVILQSATTLARVPASVDNKPLLYVPFASRADMTLDSNDKFTPAQNADCRRRRNIIISTMLIAHTKHTHIYRCT